MGLLMSCLSTNGPARAGARRWAVLALLLLPAVVCAQPETETASMRLGRLWVGVSANGAKATFSYLAGYFPNDQDILGNRGQDAEAYGGMGLNFAATDWHPPGTPADSLLPAAVYGPTNDFMPNGLVIVPITSFTRYQFPDMTVDFKQVGLTYPGVCDPTKLEGHTYDQLIDVTNQHIFGVDVHRKIMGWSQSINDDYVMVDIELTNNSTDTLRNFYVNMNEGNANMQFSALRNPPPSPGEFPSSAAATWMHYYGGRVGDTMRVFYEYNADNPDVAGDNMGAPGIAQGGRLLYSHVTYCVILHASDHPYDVAADDIDDFLQPKVTYIGNSTRFPNPPAGSDEFGSKNFWTIRGGYSDLYPMDTVNARPGTHHGINNDDRNIPDYSQYPAGLKSATNNQKRFMSFGPYTFPPGRKLHFVYASGVTGLNLQLARQVGEGWLHGTLTDPPNMPDPVRGWLPAGFAFPAGATEMDMRKDRWISTGIDSAFRKASRARWNYEHNFAIPQGAPPPEKISVTGNGTGVDIKWAALGAEGMPNFAGYRVMRRLGNADTSYYQEIYSSGPEDRGAEHLVTDNATKVGAQYYYYVQSKARIAPDDPSADPDTRGQIMTSSRQFIPDVTGSVRRYPPQDDLSKIRITPNPYNISDPRILEYGWQSTSYYGILFVNLPSTVTIRIFTENGDLIAEHFHDEPIKSGLWKWDLVSRNQQVINSGVYIAHFQTPEGNTSYQKFVVVR